jgi:hypothetical protein
VVGRRLAPDEDQQRMILIDTSVWIDFFRGRNTVFRAILHDLISGEEDICITGIILTEILQGIKDEKANNETRQYLLEFPVYNPSGIITYIEAANIYRQCVKKGKTVRRTIDCLIARSRSRMTLPCFIMIPISTTLDNAQRLD